MNEWDDDELQAWLESQSRRGEKPFESEIDDEAVRLYRQLFEELSTEPPGGLRYNFSASVVRKIQQETVVRRERRAYALLALCLLLMPGVALVMMAVFQADDLKQTVRALDVIKFPVLFMMLLFILIQWADRRFVKRKTSA